jgi:hypothetical protein
LLDFAQKKEKHSAIAERYCQEDGYKRHDEIEKKRLKCRDKALGWAIGPLCCRCMKRKPPLPSHDAA